MFDSSWSLLCSPEHLDANVNQSPFTVLKRYHFLDGMSHTLSSHFREEHEVAFGGKKNTFRWMYKIMEHLGIRLLFFYGMSHANSLCFSAVVFE